MRLCCLQILNKKTKEELRFRKKKKKNLNFILVNPEKKSLNISFKKARIRLANPSETK